MRGFKRERRELSLHIGCLALGRAGVVSMTSFKKSSFVSVTCFRGAMGGREEDGGRSEGAT